MNKITDGAVKFLYDHYENAKKYVADSEYYNEYVEEKIHHSLQVIGAMKYIMKHEDTFKNRNEEFLNYAQIATILHDVGRFKEIKNLYDLEKQGNSKDSLWTSKQDHGIYGYEILKSTPEYNNPRIYIPVKHHGHMIEELYEDEEFSSIKDEKLKKDIMEIIFLVRDADKAANYYLMTSGYDKRFPHVFQNPYSTKEDSTPIPTKSIEQFTQFEVVSREYTINFATRYLNVLSWVFDMNYIPTYDLIIKNNSLPKMADIFYSIAKDEEIQSVVEKTIADFLKMRYDEKIRVM